MSYTMEDFLRDYIKEKLQKLSPEERRKTLEGLTPEERLAGLTPEEIERAVQKLKGEHPAGPRKTRRKKK
jgi:hypothetical protein